MDISVQQRKQTTVRRTSLQHLLIQMFIALYALGFLNRNIWAFGIITISCLELILPPLDHSISLSRIFVFLLLIMVAFFTTYSIMLSSYGLMELKQILSVFLGCTAMFMAGYVLCFKGHDETRAVKLVILMAASSVAYLVLSIITTVQILGVQSMFGVEKLLNGRRVIYSLWNDTYLNGTNMGGYAVIGISLLGVILSPSQNLSEKRLKRLIFPLSIIATLCSLFIGNRSSVLIIFFSLLASIYVLFGNKYKFRVLIAILLCLAGYILYILNIFELKTTFDSSFIGVRLQTANLVEDPRLTFWEDAIKTIHLHPMGGNAFGSHNLWLDTAVTGGMIPFLFLIIFTVTSGYVFIRFLRQPHVSTMTKCVFAGCSTGILLLLFVEPIMQGYSFVLAEFCCLLGIMCAANNHVMHLRG